MVLRKRIISTLLLIAGCFILLGGCQAKKPAGPHGKAKLTRF